MMLARFTRLPLRRCLHTQAAQTISHGGLNRVGLGLAAGVVTSYFAWRMTADHNRIALDSHADSLSSADPSKRKPIQAKAPPASTQTSPESTLPGPDAPHAPETETFVGPPTDASSTIPEGESEPSSSPEGEHHGSNGAAYDPVTGEINWDCPCLGGMAYGPCGEQFREAFSCFVHSEDEPKGINCVEKFQAMQDCFRAHPEVYADEIMNDDEEETTENVHTDTTALDQSESPATTEEPESSDKPAKAQKKTKRDPVSSSAASPNPVQA